MNSSNGSSSTMRWRVKLYELESQGNWLDQGTGYVSCQHVQNLGCHALVVFDEKIRNILLESPITADGLYELQGSSIVMWREHCPAGEVDYALSFQDTAGCDAMWSKISAISQQCKYNRDMNGFRSNVMSDSNAIAEDHEQSLTVECNSEIAEDFVDSRIFNCDDGGRLNGGNNHANGKLLVDSPNKSPVSPAANSAEILIPTLPNFNTSNLDAILEKLSGLLPNHREKYALLVCESDNEMLKALLTLFMQLEVDKDLNMEHLRKCAEIARWILLLNDSSILEFFVNSEDNFYKLGGILEYDQAIVGVDPAIASYRLFLSQNAKLKQVIPCPVGARNQHVGIHPDLISTIHRMFRLNYLKDVMLPPNEDIFMGHYSSAINSMIAFDALAIVDGLCEDCEYLRNILLVIGQDSSPVNGTQVAPMDTSDGSNEFDSSNAQAHIRQYASGDCAQAPCSRSDAIAFLRELMFLTRSLTFQKRYVLLLPVIVCFT